MTAAVLGLLGVLVLAGTGSALLGERVRGPLPGLLLLVVLGATALLALLQGLEDYDMLSDTASIALGDTHVELRYLDRFTVKLPLVGDMDYKLQALKAAVPEAEKKLGEQTTGTFDLTQESITAVYTPD